MTTDNVAEMTLEQLRDELAATKRVAQLWFRKAMECEKELARQAELLTDACAARDALARKRNQWEEDQKYSIMRTIAMEHDRELAQARDELAQACSELTAVDEALGEFYCPVLDPKTDGPCGSFWKDHGVNVMRQALEMAEHAAAETRLEAEGLKRQLVKAQTDLKLNSKMLADQCDQAREAENKRDKAVRQAREWKDAWEYSSQKRYRMRRGIARLQERLTALGAVEATLTDCGNSGVYAKLDTPADAIVQMDDHIKELKELNEEHDQLVDRVEDAMGQIEKYDKHLAENLIQYAVEDILERLVGAEEELQAERRLRREAEKHVRESDDYLQWLHRILREGGYILSTNEDGIPVLAHNPLRKLEREKAEAERESKQRQRQIDLMSSGENAERRLRQEAERRAERLHREYTGMHEALDECSILRDYDDGKTASARTRIFWLNERAQEAKAANDHLRSVASQVPYLKDRAENAEAQLSNGHGTLTAADVPLDDAHGKLSITGRVVRLRQRAERAEALAQPVSEKTAGLLHRLARYVQVASADVQSPLLRAHSWCNKDAEAARELAAQIREALDDGQAT